MSFNADSTRFLRRALLADCVVSAASGLLLLAAPAAIASLIGAPSAGLVAAVGAALVMWGLWLWRNSRREALRRSEAVATVALNLAWVVASGVVIAGGGLTREGNWIVAFVADAVLAFAVMEVIGLRKIGPRMAREAA